MKYVMLLFLWTLFILFIGVFLGFNIIENTYELSLKTQELSAPFKADLDINFIRTKSF